MNEKNSLDINKCFGELENPIDLFELWFNEAKNSEINDPNALSLATADSNGIPSVRMVLLKSFDNNGFVFYTNLGSKKSKDLKSNPFASMCFHWKSLLRQVRISGKIEQVSNEEADKYYASRSYDSRIGAWASKQSSVLNNRGQLFKAIEKFNIKYPDKNKVPRPEHWSGWRVNPEEIEFWLDGDNRIHERLKYYKDKKNWTKKLLSP